MIEFTNLSDTRFHYWNMWKVLSVCVFKVKLCSNNMVWRAFYVISKSNVFRNHQYDSLRVFYIIIGKTFFPSSRINFYELLYLLIISRSSKTHILIVCCLLALFLNTILFKIGTFTPAFIEKITIFLHKGQCILIKY